EELPGGRPAGRMDRHEVVAPTDRIDKTGKIVPELLPFGRPVGSDPGHYPGDVVGAVAGRDIACQRKTIPSVEWEPMADRALLDPGQITPERHERHHQTGIVCLPDEAVEVAEVFGVEHRLVPADERR